MLTPFTNTRILVAEDNQINQLILSKILKDWGVDVDIVDDGLKVIEKLKHNDYDLVLLDTYMPKMNGYQTAKAIRTDFDEPKRTVPIISLSAASLEHEKEAAILAGMDDVLTKPFEFRELREKIESLLYSVATKQA